MAILQNIKTAVDCFLELAYPGELPDKTKKLLNSLHDFHSDKEFWDWDFLEKEGNRTSMRWGNGWYPHMKLTFRGTTPEQLLFYVDVHDKHFALPKQYEDRLVKIRNKNFQTKQLIESLFSQKHLSIMDRSLENGMVFEPLPRTVKLLAIDDESHILNLIQIFIKKIGAEVHLCTNAKQAIAYLEEQHPVDIVLCDIMMPEQSGYSVYKWISEHEYDLDFYFVTGLAKEAIKYPGVSVLQKPFRVCDLYNIIQNFIQSRP